jgi:adenylate cyclase
VNRASSPSPAYPPNTDVAGIEREVAILFIDIRGFTTLSERKLPFDVVPAARRLDLAAGRLEEPVEDEHHVEGQLALGERRDDGLLALFTHPDGIAPACRSAFAAAGAVDRAVTDLNRDEATICTSAALARDSSRLARFTAGPITERPRLAPAWPPPCR